eukprot:m.786672 g.786672  ORF g.786672 m.786672 type:complete len:100 (-) comp23306_c0_seq2:1724-2023(-)
MHTRLYRARAEVCVVTPTYVTLVILSVANTAAAGGGVPEMMTENAMPTRRPHVPRPGTQSMGESSGSDPGIAHYIACSTMLRKRCVARRCTYYAYSVVE